MPLNQQQISNYNSTIDWPCELSNDFKERFLSGAIKKTHISGSEFNLHNQDQYGIYYLLKGSLMMSAPLLTDGFSLSKLYGPTDWMCYAPIMNFKFPSGMAGEFLQNIEYLKIPISHLNYLMSQSDELFKLLFFIKSMRSDTMFEKCLVSLATPSIVKVSYTLLDICRVQNSHYHLFVESPNDATPIKIKITQQQIACLAGLNRSNTSTIINEFAIQGIVEQYRGGLYVNDLKELKSFLNDVNLLESSKLS
ncbi:helix-turn-helix domain-containing protein [Thalassotalea psychrophila]|uniref:Helix-turn-helix domain-containing protein n=1 Tax=Thalassotalea psychrophila TaxID=3065647 RepID=A0ABY9TXS4_9GAMM|nr:helix-turn-helix domain-containing protein [Colwelliaceae bacterium SQ149]